MTEPGDRVTLYAYDELNRLTQTTQPDTSTESWTYGCCGLESHTDRSGTIVTTTYDRLGNRLTETAPHQPNDPDPPTTTYTHDALGRLITVINPAGQIITTEYHEDFTGAVTAVKFQASVDRGRRRHCRGTLSRAGASGLAPLRDRAARGVAGRGQDGHPRRAPG